MRKYEILNGEYLSVDKEIEHEGSEDEHFSATVTFPESMSLLSVSSRADSAREYVLATFRRDALTSCSITIVFHTVYPVRILWNRANSRVF